MPAIEQDLDAASQNSEDIFSLFMPLLFGYEPITHADAGAIFTYRQSLSTKEDIAGNHIKLRVPDTLAKNNALHASSVWSSAVYLADHFDQLGILDWTAERISSGKRCEVLELGAGAGLPGIALAKVLESIAGKDGSWKVTLSDYPDDNVINTLRRNVAENDLSNKHCVVSAYNWGTDPASILTPTSRSDAGLGFDLILAADTLWNSDSHANFMLTLKTLLRRDADARAHLIAGFHTGRFVIQRFLDAVISHNDVLGSERLEIAHVEERMVTSTFSSEEDKEVKPKPWDPHREDYDPKERRKWVVWIVLRWPNQLAN